MGNLHIGRWKQSGHSMIPEIRKSPHKSSAPPLSMQIALSFFRYNTEDEQSCSKKYFPYNCYLTF